ncbi:MAG: TAXI family TRAP transporter solute-binding subunit [Burkholderiaceae bacterium]|nr:TAXI family TRAP transporter solute-binding subunit [Burkholderiaceae bacterium]
MKTSRRQVIQGAGGLAAAGVLGGSGLRSAVAAESLPNLPAKMIWSTYGKGSAGYVEASAVAQAMGKKYGTQVRLQPSGTAIGRIKPVIDGRVSHGWLANELYFAVEGIYEYAAPDVGPQNLRTLMGRANSLSIAVTKTSGIKSLQELKGKRFAIARANSSVNVKVEPILAFAGLSWDDLDLVEFPSYGATMKALIEGKAEAGGFAPSSALLRELEASRYGIHWLALDPANKEGWGRVKKVVPFVEPFHETIGAGLSEANPVWMLGYRYPMVTVQAGANADEVYAMIKAIVETFPMYKDVNKITPRWDVKRAGTPPMDAAFHDGAIRYLKEIGIWTAEHQAWQDGMLKRHGALQAGWKELLAKTPNAKSLDIPGMQKLWMPRRAEILKSL